MAKGLYKWLYFSAFFEIPPNYFPSALKVLLTLMLSYFLIR